MPFGIEGRDRAGDVHTDWAERGQQLLVVAPVAQCPQWLSPLNGRIGVSLAGRSSTGANPIEFGSGELRFRRSGLMFPSSVNPRFKNVESDVSATLRLSGSAAAIVELRTEFCGRGFGQSVAAMGHLRELAPP
jgi:hypothetical protein